MLKLENVWVRYDEALVVSDVSLQLLPGQWLMLCGPNGAGKSTLVKAIAQGVKYKGRMTLHGRDMKNIRPAALAREIGVLSQTNAVSYAFTVEEVVTLGRYAHSRGIFASKDTDGAARVKEALHATGLLPLKEQSMLTLSGGEMQRAFLAQVFAQEPSLLILDEPANHLDLVYQRQLFTLIENWLKTPGRAVISVVHDLNLAKKYGTHTLLMHEGRTIAQGETQKVLSREHLQAVYGMDVHAWMKDMLLQWAE